MVFASFFFFLLAVFLSSWGKKPSSAMDGLGILPKKGQNALFLVAWGLAAAIACMMAAWAISAALYFLGVLDSHIVQARMESFPLPILIFAFTLAPLSEEALFRGALFQKIFDATSASSSPSSRRLHLPFLASASLSSVLFALMHMGYGSFAEIIAAFSIGIVLCITAARTNSLIPSIVAHACFNLASITITMFLL